MVAKSSSYGKLNYDKGMTTTMTSFSSQFTAKTHNYDKNDNYDKVFDPLRPHPRNRFSGDGRGILTLGNLSYDKGMTMV
jgi:hypothetical protein